MKYFIIDDSLDENIVGKDYPQAYKFIKGYNPEDSNALFSLYKYVEKFPDYTPNLNGIMMSGSALMTDFVSSGFSSYFFILSNKAKVIFEQYNLCPHRFYPLGLYKRKIKHDYFLLSIISDYSYHVDYRKSTFNEYNIINGRRYDSVLLGSREELLQKGEKLDSDKGVEWAIWGDKIIMNKKFDSQLDFFKITRIDSNVYVSERLKEEIESQGLTGWEFTPADNLIVTPM